ncbi:Uncharacterized protein dnl_35490 [Desulfonema limicola]|uniref:Uncharacterized protein n=1 Tax=Desulfonema limicola TaxID=45656 RepID=A0A975B9H5_9BACT|nr:hypothetical protein [Desulfonema limicola]QTA81218.1 Uncharacterized protein dnl_35490 [Desulfonema limicola]
MRLKYTDRSADDLELTFSWYERQRRGLEFEFNIFQIKGYFYN